MSTATKTRPRLGRGLSSLISVSNLPVEAEVHPGPAHHAHPSPGTPAAAGAVATAADLPQAARPNGTPLLVPIDSIRPNPHQPRKTFSDASIADLAASLKSSGIIQPLVVRAVDGGYELIAGQRRLKAAKIAGLSEIPVITREVDSYAQAQLALVENIQREDLNPIERAQAYRALMDQLGLTQAELASRMGEERSSIANYLRLLELSEGVRTMVRDGRLSLGHAKILAGIADILKQQKLAQAAVDQGLSVRALESLLQADTAAAGAQPVSPPKKPAALSAHLADLEKSLTRQMGLRVQVRSASKGKGRLILHYSSLDQFDDLMGKLGVKPE
jgi:ParB family chromosome partitioning protein